MSIGQKLVFSYELFYYGSLIIPSIINIYRNYFSHFNPYSVEVV